MSDQNQPPDPLELLRRMWAPMSLPIPGMVVPLADPADVEKRIADLKSVEHWLTLNLNVVKMSIQGLEMQHATLTALHAAQQSLGRRAGEAAKQVPEQGPVADADPARAANAPNPLEAWWSMLQPPHAPAGSQPPAEPPPDAAPADTRSRRDPSRRSNGGAKKGR